MLQSPLWILLAYSGWEVGYTLDRTPVYHRTYTYRKVKNGQSLKFGIMAITISVLFFWTYLDKMVELERILIVTILFWSDRYNIKFKLWKNGKRHSLHNLLCWEILLQCTGLHWSDNTAKKLDVDAGLNLARGSSKSTTESGSLVWKDSCHNTHFYQYKVQRDRTGNFSITVETWTTHCAGIYSVLFFETQFWIVIFSMHGVFLKAFLSS